MKTYRVTVNGNIYHVVVEETSGLPVAGPLYPVMQQPFAQAPAAMPVATPAAPAAPAAAPAAPAEAHEPTPAASAAEGSIKITAPMPGSIWDIKVAQGDKVKKNQVVIILEAMKMENEIVSPADGTIAGIHVTTGTTVTPGQLLISMSE